MKRTFFFIILVISSTFCFSQPAFKATWLNFAYEPDYEHTFHTRKVCRIKYISSDIFAEEIENYNDQLFDDLWDSIEMDSLEIDNIITNAYGLDNIYSYGENGYGAIWKAFYDSSNLYVLFKHWDKKGIEDDNTTKFEVRFQTSPRTNMKEGRYERDFRLADTKREKNQSYARYIELGGAILSFQPSEVYDFSGVLGQEAKWHTHPFLESMKQVKQYMEKGTDGFYRSICVIPFDIGLAYPGDPHGDIFSQDWIAFDPFKNPMSDTILVDISNTANHEGESFRFYWAADEAAGWLSNYYSGLLIFDGEVSIVVDPLVIYCQGEPSEPLEAYGENLKWYNTPGGNHMTTPPIPSTEVAGTFEYYVTETVNGVESVPVKITVEVKEGVELNLSDYVINTSSQNISLSATSNYEGEGSVSYTWNGLSSNNTGASISYSSETPEALTVLAIADNGCMDEDEVLILDQPELIYTESDGESHQLEDGTIIRTFASNQIRRYTDLTMYADTLWSNQPATGYGISFTNDFFILDSSIIAITRHMLNGSNLKVVAGIRAVNFKGETLVETPIPSAYPLKLYNEIKHVNHSLVNEDNFVLAFGEKLLVYDKELNLVDQLEKPGYIFHACKFQNNKFYTVYTENNPDQLWESYHIAVYDRNLNFLKEKEFSSHARQGMLSSLDLAADGYGNVFIVEDAYLDLGDNGDVALVKYNLDFSEIWVKYLEKENFNFPSACRTLNNNNILVLSGGNFLYNIGKNPQNSYKYYTGGDGLFSSLWQTDHSHLTATGLSGSVSYKLDLDDGEFLPWFLKANLTHDESYNPEKVICEEGEVGGLKLKLDFHLYGLVEDSIKWSNGARGRESIFKTPGKHYANFTWLGGNTGITDTFNVGDHYTIMEIPVVSIESPFDRICDGQSSTVSFEILNDNGKAYTFENITTGQEFGGTLSLTDNGEYDIRITDNYGCIRDTSVRLFVKEPFADNLCMVSVDNESGKNKIYWNQTEHKGTQTYRLLRGLGHTEVGTKSFGDENYIIDQEVDPRIMAYRYFLESIDTCGNAVIHEVSHKTIHLTANKGTSGEVNLIWQPYEGLNFYKYNIYRSTDSVNFQLIGGLEYDPSISQYTDFNPPAGDLYYQIGIEGDFDCSSVTKKAENQTFNEIFSNVKALKTSGAELINRDDGIAVYPNPAKDYLIIENKDNKASCHIRLMNVMGVVVMEKKMVNSRVQIALDSGLQPGLYMIRIIDESGWERGCRMIYID